ncbi:MAG: UDP-N-acetylmuramoyl-L-alanyl-D-glutamate--2,6-diaminopimelate ligase [Gammaproteobacteria bacterium]|nr:UDP-N-acetylmuramoyl-L-alanyl-D-glutamate--2,6-diaminopimelate ligase [Gammaproteobacteria bacterium]
MSASVNEVQVSLRSLFNGIAGVTEVPDVIVNDMTADSRRVRSGSLFLACHGGVYHGLEFADAAIAANVAAIAWEPQHGLQLPELPDTVTAFPVDDLSAQVGDIADRFFAEPSAKIMLTGITGTNGKTTTAWLATEALNHLAGKSAYMGTLGYGVIPELKSSELTTPGCISVHRRLRQLLDTGVSKVVMEVSSHGLDQGRIDGVRINTAAFTNLSRDHLDYHGDLTSYKAAKAKLFAGAALRTAVINTGDAFGAELADDLAEGIQVIKVALVDQLQNNHQADLCATYSQVVGGGLQISFTGRFGAAEMTSALWGRFNAENLLVAVGILLAHGYSLEQAVVALEASSVPPGRMQVITGSADNPIVIVDFAHTPDALAQALQTLRGHCTGKVVCVFGCGGDRDHGKRAEMGAIAEQLADYVVVTTDNPRDENCRSIIDAIVTGMVDVGSYEVIEDRAEAIARAIHYAEAGDAVLVAGKGSENYQLIADRVEAFSDEDVALGVLGVAS